MLRGMLKSRYLCPILLLSGTLLVWGTSLWNGFVWDDRILIQKNEANLSSVSLVQAFFSDFWSTETERGQSNYYRPLVSLSYMLDYAVYGLNPAGYHATNILIHTGCVLALWYLLVLLGLSSGSAAVAAGLWAVHPSVAESVAWVSGRTDSLATLCMLLSVVTAIQGGEAKGGRSRWILYSAGFFGAGLLCKESALVTPLLTVLFLIYMGKRGKIDGAFVYGSLAVLLAWVVLRVAVLAQPIGAEAGEGMPLSLVLLSLLHTWGTLVWPPAFRIEYGSSLTGQALVGGAALGAILLVWMVLVIISNQGSRIVRYLYLAALVAFIPSVMAVVLKSMIGSRLVYTASAFVLVGFVQGLRIVERTPRAKRAFAAVFVILAVMTVQRAQLWRSDITLFSAALEAPDPSTRNHLNLGIALFDDGDLAGALIQLHHDMEHAALDQKYYMLSLLYTAIRCEGLAEEYLGKSIEASPTNYSAYHNLAGLQAVQGRNDEARQTLTKIAERDPSLRRRAFAQLETIKKLPTVSSRMSYNSEWCGVPLKELELFKSPVQLNRLAGEHLRAGQLDLAEVLIRAALRVDPWFVGARLNFAQLYMLKGDNSKARDILESILDTEPGEQRARRLLSTIEGGGTPGRGR
jgi:Flp pilus assembly protein TadD